MLVGNSRYSYIEGLTRYIIDPYPQVSLSQWLLQMDQVCRVTPQLSAVVGAAMATTAEQLPSIVVHTHIARTRDNLVSSLSTTVTVKLHCAEFPAASSM